ncbi:Endonuclease 4 [Vitis vinifera]|uniref:Aspergillus nuclease S1 n=1 Tax=Vitis vinifera TaxID=29760 RepID=A0A438JHV0_VITVI|nr:Endonuclease 4 [Vitis vinifera]
MAWSGVLLIVRALVLLQLIPGILSWGKEGHYAVCKIAEGFLSEDALGAVKGLLPDYADGDLAAVCSWADEIRHNFHWRWSGPLHYVDTPDYRCNYEYCSKFGVVVIFPGDCHDFRGHKDICVTGAIYNYTKQLTSGYHNSGSEIRYNLTEALMFLSHFIGDVHQVCFFGTSDCL